MEENLKIASKTYQLKRYPITHDKSLRAWSNAELLALDYVSDKEIKSIHVYNDRFGVWNCTLHNKDITTVWTYASQQKAILKNLALNNLSTDVEYKTPLEDLDIVDMALIKIPKSLELFELFLQQIQKSSHKNTEIICCFMVKYFSASFLKIANLYFDEVTQTKAWKKARLLILKKPKEQILKKELINVIPYEDKFLKQHYGVFSSGAIDMGTRFLLEDLQVYPEEKKVLDLASGNGIIAGAILQENTTANMTLIDDFNLAIASSKFNITKDGASFICDDSLDRLKNKNFDLVVSNPPFHFEFENNIEITLSLFKQVKDCLKQNGRFLLVANFHLNYKTHLAKIFSSVLVLKSNKKFVVYECIK